MDYRNIFIDSRNKPLCDVPELNIGCVPVCGGNYLFTDKQMLEFIELEPESKKFFRKWYGSKEFIDKKPRYCLYIGDYDIEDLDAYPYIIERIKNVRNIRLSSSSPSTRMFANVPTKFKHLNMPENDYLIIPCISSCKRKYIPIGFLSAKVLSSNKVFIMENPTLYHFAVLTSNVHMIWNYYLCGRLKDDYNYTKVGVYNNFPWPNPTKKQKQKIEETAQHILDIRNKYKDKTYKYLYDPNTMPYDLLLAHERNDKAVMEAYNISEEYTNEQIIEKLIYLYVKKVRELNEKGNSR